MKIRNVRALIVRGVVLSGLGLLAACNSGSDRVTEPPQTPPDSSANPCTEADAALDPACLLQGNAANVVREVCNVQWLPGVCEIVAFDEPGYAVDSDPNPQSPLFLAVGAVHEHSGYSDGDPQMIPRDYFTAGRTGHNTADAGGDTGVIIDFMISSEHSENEKLPVTTAEACIPLLINCANLDELDHYFKWQAALRQAGEGSEFTDEDGLRRYTGFTAMRGFEWTNDYYNHMNVYLSTNVVNAKIDGSYLSMQFFWNWLREPVAEGGGADALVTFNHPGGNPSLTPFDGDTPLNELLALLGNSNWDDLSYVADVDRNVIGIEVNGGDDIEWYVKALERGWHLGPVAAEDEHQREWSTTEDGKTLILTRGRSPQDYYYALLNRRTAAVRHELIDGAPGTRAIYPGLLYWANGAAINEGVPMGSIVREAGAQTLEIDFTGLPAGSPVALISSHGAQAMPQPLGLADAGGALRASQLIDAPQSGEDWYFVVVCPVDETACGSNQNVVAVTAPIWFGPGG
jgi:hypothetical protein